jgi:hypothetical protein
MAHSAVQKQDYITGMQHRVARIRILPKKVMSAETERLAKVCNKLQTNILDRVKLPQSSCGDFPLATGLLFGRENMICETTEKACVLIVCRLWTSVRC